MTAQATIQYFRTNTWYKSVFSRCKLFMWCGWDCVGKIKKICGWTWFRRGTNNFISLHEEECLDIYVNTLYISLWGKCLLQSLLSKRNSLPQVLSRVLLIHQSTEFCFDLWASGRWTEPQICFRSKDDFSARQHSSFHCRDVLLCALLTLITIYLVFPHTFASVLCRVKPSIKIYKTNQEITEPDFKIPQK